MPLGFLEGTRSPAKEGFLDTILEEVPEEGRCSEVEPDLSRLSGLRREGLRDASHSFPEESASMC